MQQIGLDAVLNNVPDFTGGIDKMNRAVDSFAKNGKDAGTGFEKGFGEIVTGALRHIGTLAVDALLKAGQAITGFVKDSIGLAGNFEAGMLNFQAVAGQEVDAKGLEEFRDLFIDIGKRLPVSTADVQAAAIEMVKGGIDPAIIAAGGLERNIQFAAAAMDGDLVKAAEISSKILGGWSDANATATEKTDFLARATDLLTKAANASATDVEGLSRGIFQAQGIAKTAGVSFDDLTTTLALLAPRFASSAEAGTSVKNMIARLQPTTDPATVAMQRLGLYTEETGSAFYDAAGNFVGFETASQLLQTSLQGLTKEQQAAALQTIFGNDAMGAAAALADGGALAYQNMAQALLTANGVSENAALKQQGFDTALENTKGSVEAMQIQLGSHLLPILSDLLDNYITPGINAFSDWASAILESDDPIQALITSIDDIVPGFESFVDNATILATYIEDNLEPILAGLALAITVAVVPALAAATVGFIAAAAPIAALVAAGALLYAAWDSDFLGIKTTVTQVWTDTLEPAFKDMQAWLEEKLPPAIKTLSDFWTDTLQPALEDVWKFLKDKVFPVLSDLTDVFIAAAIIEVKALAALWTDVLQPALKVVWDFISGSVIPIFKALFEVNWAIATKAVEAMSGLWQKVLQPAFKAVGDYITTTVVPAFKSVGDYLTATFGPILTDAKKWLDSVTGGFGGVKDAVFSLINNLSLLASTISNLKLPDWLTPGSPTPWETALLGIGKALQKVTPGLGAMQRSIKEIGTQIVGTFQSTDIIDALTGLGEDAMAGFGIGIRDGFRSVRNIIESTADNVEDAFNDAFGSHSPSTLMMPVGANITDGIATGIKNALPGLHGIADQVGVTLASRVKKMTEDMARQIEKTVQDIKDQVSEAQDAIADLQIGGLNATASINRQKISNLEKFADVAERLKGGVQFQLEDAEKVAQGISDPQQAAAWFRQRSNQIFELADITSKLDRDLTDQQARGFEANLKQYELDLDALGKEDEDTTQEAAQRAHIMTRMAEAQARLNDDLTDAARQMLIDKYQLVNAAQNAETKALEQTQQQGSATQDVIAQLQALLASPNMPGLLESPLINSLTTLLGQLVSPPSTRPPTSGGTTSNYSQAQTINMPVYTNMSPSAIQDSMAIASAALL